MFHHHLTNPDAAKQIYDFAFQREISPSAGEKQRVLCLV